MAEKTNDPDDATLPEAVVEGVQDRELVRTRRDQICQAALELFLEKGFASTTIRDICARSGVNQASIYDYVANKHDILRRLLNRVWFRTDVPTLPERLDRDGHGDFEGTVREYLRELWAAKREGILLAYRTVPHLRDEDRRALTERETRMMRDLAVHLRRRAGLPDGDERAEVVANMILFQTAFDPMRGWLLRDVDPEVSLRAAAAAVTAMADSLRAAPGSGPVAS